MDDFYTNDFLYDYYDWVCSETDCQLCNVLTAECCDPAVNVNCQLPDSCLNNPCLSGGTCITSRTINGNRPDFICVCLPGFTGKYCQLTNDFMLEPPTPVDPFGVQAQQSYGYGLPQSAGQYGQVVQQPPMGYPQPPVGFPQQPVGYPQPPVGFPQPPVGYPQQPQGYPQQPQVAQPPPQYYPPQQPQVAQPPPQPQQGYGQPQAPVAQAPPSYGGSSANAGAKALQQQQSATAWLAANTNNLKPLSAKSIDWEG